MHHFAAILFLLTSQTVCANAKYIYIIDTDAGADDGRAIAYAAHAVRNELDAVTITPGNCDAETGSGNIRRILDLMNSKGTPVFLGAQKPLINSLKTETFFGNDSFGDVPLMTPVWHKRQELEKMRRQHSAPEHIVRTARQYPKQVTLICLGPLTNIAMAFVLEPNLPNLLKKTVVQGGSLNARGSMSATGSFNFFKDPEAARIVLDNFKPLVFPSDVASKYSRTWDQYRQEMSLETPVARFLRAIYAKAAVMYQEWGSGYKLVDEAAVAIAIRPDLVKKSKWLPSTVEVCGTDTRGQMVIDYRSYSRAKKNVEVVLEYDANVAHTEFRAMLRTYYG